MSNQLHAGKYFSTVYDEIRSAWHTNMVGNWWIGYHPDGISPEDLYLLTQSTLIDLLTLYPDLPERVRKSGKTVALGK